MFNDREREFLSALLSEEVAFAVIGGTAVYLHGVTSRPRDDLDILFSNENENLERLGHVDLTWWSLSSRKLDELRKPGARVAKNQFNIELLSRIDGVGTAEVLSTVEWIEAEALKVPVISKGHLILNKKAVGEAKDLQDVAALQGQQ